MSLIKKAQEIWKIDELRNRILITLFLMLVFRFGSYLPLPGIDPEQLSALQNQTEKSGILGLLNAFTGGAFSKASILALGIMPYISASIVVQLMGMAIPYLQKLQKDGQSGRNKINQITRWLTIVITFVQAPSYITNLKVTLPSQAFLLDNSIFWSLSIILLTTGTLFAVWIGEKITDKGIGNGVSLLITVGIVARLPQAVLQEVTSKVYTNAGGVLFILVESLIWLAVIGLCILLVQAVRKIPLQYAKAQGGRVTYVNTRQFLPLRLNSSGVMPIIFAQALMFVPIALGSFTKSEAMYDILRNFSDIYGFWYNATFFMLIVVFTFVYTAISMQTGQMAEEMKRNGSFIPGVSPGASTASYIDDVLSKLTLPSAIFLGLIAILPTFAYLIGVSSSFALFYGGTSLLIMVGVALDTLSQVNSFLLNKHYDGLLKSGRITG